MHILLQHYYSFNTINTIDVYINNIIQFDINIPHFCHNGMVQLVNPW